MRYARLMKLSKAWHLTTRLLQENSLRLSGGPFLLTDRGGVRNSGWNMLKLLWTLKHDSLCLSRDVRDYGALL